MEGSVNSLIVALTNLLFSRVRLVLFNALKACTDSSKRILKSFNLTTCLPKLIRKSSIDVRLSSVSFESFVGLKSGLVYVF